jgi:hypothetical protein
VKQAVLVQANFQRAAVMGGGGLIKHFLGGNGQEQMPFRYVTLYKEKTTSTFKWQKIKSLMYL